EQLCSEIGGLHYVSRSEGAEVYETTPHMLSDEDIRQTGGIYWRETKGFMHAYLKLQKERDGRYGRAEFEVIGEPYLNSDITERMRRPECFNHVLAKISNADHVEKAIRNRDASYKHQRGRTK
ncbi:hypothetical protein KY363_05195, partial [Candidatus Woesearchaeota archaeon]|nr:hypothetical protein [Candidatus Woesearchaeota archaeon]